MADHTDHLTGTHMEINIGQSPELSIAEALPGRAPAEFTQRVGCGVAQATFGAKAIPLGDTFELEQQLCHGVKPEFVQRRGDGLSGR